MCSLFAGSYCKLFEKAGEYNLRDMPKEFSDYLPLKASDNTYLEVSLLCRFHLFIRQYILYRVNGRQQSQYDTATQLLDDFEWAMNGYGLVPMIAEKKRNYKDDDSIRKMNIFNKLVNTSNLLIYPYEDR